MPHNPIGSTWIKCDLHFHTPSSFDYKDKSVTNEQIVECLIEHDIKLIAITDHHKIDIDRISKLKEFSENKITILPGIELRSNQGSKELIHYIGLFPEEIDLEHLQATVYGQLGLTELKLRQKGGDERVYVPLHEACEVIANLNGIVSIHAGKKSNSIESIDNTEQFHQQIKIDIAKQVNILEVGRLKDVNVYRDIIFKNTGLNLPVVTGSDNHNINEYKSPNCWLKANPTFLGLRQVINEPVDRVFLGEKPDILKHLEQNRTRYIKSVHFNKEPQSTLPEKWFPSDPIEFNHGLIAIIGNKGNGKSALADTIGLLGNCPHHESFSFLHTDQFRHTKHNKANDFSAKLTWYSNESIERKLSEEYSPNDIESVIYIPQFHLETICDELKGGKDGKFNEEIKQVIFSRVPQDKRFGKGNLDEILKFRTEESEQKIRDLVNDLKTATITVVELEDKSAAGHKELLESKLKSINDEIRVHMNEKPQEIAKPTSASSQPTSFQLDAELIEEKKLEERIKELKDQKGQLIYKLECLEKISKRLSNLEEQVENLSSDIAEYTGLLELNFADLVKFSINGNIINEKKKSLELSNEEIDKELDIDSETSITNKLKVIQDKISDLRAQLDEPNKQYQNYIEKNEIWQKRLIELQGDENIPNTQRSLESQLKSLSDLPAQLKEARKKQTDCASKIFREKLDQLKAYEELYKPLQDFIDNHQLAKEKYNLKFNVSLVSSNFIEKFMPHINQGRKGSFYGQEDGRAVLKQIVDSANFQSEDGVIDFIDQLIDHLIKDKRSQSNIDNTINQQLKQGIKPNDLYEYIYGLEYLQPRYVLTWEGKSLDQLSPGERGTLLLIFYLLIEDSGLPLIIDQPESNLDNHTVYDLLVECIKEAKKKRQIFIVTHNPNLAVVCDAEQVIHASLDKQNNHTLTYTSGALENRKICELIIDVLEGTRPAINNRIAKYRLIFDQEPASV